jgi:hypothetical protein
MVGKLREEEFSDPIITNFVKEDKVPWYKKKNLRMLYFALYPACEWEPFHPHRCLV